jgi:hypothetical protein
VRVAGEIGEDLARASNGRLAYTTQSARRSGAKPFGEDPSAYYVFTKGGRFINVSFSSDRKPPAGAGPTDAERIELFKTMSATSGTYKLQDGKVAITYATAWRFMFFPSK